MASRRVLPDNLAGHAAAHPHHQQHARQFVGQPRENSVPFWIITTVIIVGVCIFAIAAAACCWHMGRDQGRIERDRRAMWPFVWGRGGGGAPPPGMPLQQQPRGPPPNPEIAGYYSPAGPPPAQAGPRSAEEQEARQQVRGFYEPTPLTQAPEGGVMSAPRVA
ncbi:uncharacterized protein E0L32_007084 [Thyridium curvatum]|uniref:Uncharacterized protein n=1 Tax=Thyridium curvatum TaxID=1093900 RepID=A0A507B5S5_9PEZI|nr:uncharacterized protein E0L32_007084 [Thyridium curvatum]TPX12198.1 hypothetical protein E0L32_007084 [Thyridium curvatum]